MNIHAANTGQYPAVIPDTVFMPETWHDIKALLEKALRDNKKVGVIGGGYSWTPGYHTSGYQICTRKLNAIGNFNIESLTIDVGAGTTLRQLNAYLQAHHLPYALTSVVSIDNASLGGIVSNGCHGNSLSHGPIADYVKRFSIITVKNNIVERMFIDCVNSDIESEHLKNGMGLCGIMDSLTLQLEPAYTVKVSVSKCHDDFLNPHHPENLATLCLNNSQVLITALPLTRKLIIRTLQKTSMPHKHYSLAGQLPWFVAPYCSHLSHLLLNKFPWLTRMVNLCLHGFYPADNACRTISDAVHFHKHQEKNPCLLASFAFLAAPDLANVIKAWATMNAVITNEAKCGRYAINLALNLRFVCGTANPLSPAYGNAKDTFAVIDIVSHIGTTGYEQAIRCIVHAWQQAGLTPKPFWAKLGTPIMGKTFVQAVFQDALGSFLDTRAKMDPGQIFLNDYYRELFSIEAVQTTKQATAIS